MIDLENLSSEEKKAIEEVNFINIYIIYILLNNKKSSL